MRKLTATLALLALLAGFGTAQRIRIGKNPGKSTRKVVTITIKQDGKTRTYKKVMKDGKVIEESGDPGLLDGTEIDVKGLMDGTRGNRHRVIIRERRGSDEGAGEGPARHRIRRLLRHRGKDGTHETKSGSRRIVIKDGKVIQDTRTGDPDAGFEIDIDDLEEGIRLHAPEIKDALKNLHVEIPDIRVHVEGLEKLHELMPELKSRLKDLHVEIPDIKLDVKGLEKLHEIAPRIRMRLEGLEKLHEVMPDLKAHLKELHRQIPELDDIMEGIEIELPDVEGLLRGIELDVPRSSIEKPRVKRRIVTRPAPRSKAGRERREATEIRKQMRDLQRQMRKLQREIERLAGDAEKPRARHTRRLRM